MNQERKMATIRKIDNILPIEGADNIEVAVVGGWKVVVKKGEFKVGELAVYCEVDSWIPEVLAPFLTKKQAQTFNGVVGNRLRTVKLRGQISQGLLLKLYTDCKINWVGINSPFEYNTFFSQVEEDMDVSALLNIQKFEKPEEFRAANAKGNFPPFIRKTDQERIQNMKKKINDIEQDSWEVTEKLDGSSMNVYVFNKEAGVCSRNLDLKEEEGNTFWSTARKNQIIKKIQESGLNLAIQGELIGPGIQGNKYNLTEYQFHVFDIFDIDEQTYLLPEARRNFCNNLGITHVPVIGTNLTFNFHEKESSPIDFLLQNAEGKSKLNPNTEREGLVFKSVTDNEFSFKVVSNKWLQLFD